MPPIRTIPSACTRDPWSPPPSTGTDKLLRASTPFSLTALGLMTVEEALNAEFCSNRPAPDHDALTVEDSDFLRAASPFTLAVHGVMTPAEAFEAEWSDRAVPGRDAWIVGDGDFNQADLHPRVDRAQDITVDPKDVAPQERIALEAQPAQPSWEEDLGYVSDGDGSNAGSDESTDTIDIRDSALICPFRESDPQNGCDRLVRLKDFHKHLYREHFKQFYCKKRWNCPLDKEGSPDEVHKCGSSLKVRFKFEPSRPQPEATKGQLNNIVDHIFKYNTSHAYQPLGYRIRKREDGSSEKFGPKCRVAHPPS